MTNFSTQTTMKAAQIKDYGEVREMVSVEDHVPIPTLSNLSPAKRKDYLILRTLAVSLAPGDTRTLSGLTRELQGPPSFPYIPAGDCCGIVTEVHDEKGSYDKDWDVKVGDLVTARFFDFPRNSMAEYAIVHKGVCEKVMTDTSEKENEITPEAAAALASATPAILIADRVNKGERVLVFGAGGGLGSHVCQCLRERGASYIVGVSQNPERLLAEPLSCDAAIDYTKENVWDKQEYIEEPFDVIIDLAGWGWTTLWNRMQDRDPVLIKTAANGGRFLTTVPDNPTFEIHSVWGALKVFLFPSLSRAFYSRTYRRRSLPKYTFAMSLPSTRDVLTRTLEFARRGNLKACIDGPYPFTTEGVQDAFLKQKSCHPNGKVIVKIADK